LKVTRFTINYEIEMFTHRLPVDETRGGIETILKEILFSLNVE